MRKISLIGAGNIGTILAYSLSRKKIGQIALIDVVDGLAEGKCLDLAQSFPVDNINGKIENGRCTIEYPKKIFCEYARSNNKILVSDGRYLVVKTRSSFYQYPVKKTPLNLILDKNFLIEKIYKLNERVINGDLINYTVKEKDYEISIFFDKQNYNLVGWQNVDMYQNFNITFISGIRKNRLISKNLFKIPTRN